MTRGTWWNEKAGDICDCDKNLFRPHMYLLLRYTWDQMQLWEPGLRDACGENVRGVWREKRHESPTVNERFGAL